MKKPYARQVAIPPPAARSRSFPSWCGLPRAVRTGVIVVLSCSLLGALAGGLLLCPRCGYEYEQEDEHCAHCRALLPTRVTEDAPEAAVEEDDAGGDEPDALRHLVRDSMIEALAAQREGHAGLALFHVRQVRALAAGLPEEYASLRERAGLLAGNTLHTLRNQRRTCPLCDGQGSRRVLTFSLGREPIQMDQPAQPCPFCEGLAYRPSFATSREVQQVVASGRADFQEFHMARGHTRLGDLWLPPGMESGWTIHARAQVLSAASAHCSDCHGLGTFGCASCDGMGRTVCEREGCVMGRAACDTCKGSGREDILLRGQHVNRRCSRCNGRGVTDCDNCEGNGFLTCTRCRGSAQTPCATCKGDGAADLCGRCDGAGLAVCRRCNASGNYRGQDCPYCRAEGVQTCSSCRGTGTRRRQGR